MYENELVKPCGDKATSRIKAWMPGNLPQEEENVFNGNRKYRKHLDACLRRTAFMLYFATH